VPPVASGPRSSTRLVRTIPDESLYGGVPFSTDMHPPPVDFLACVGAFDAEFDYVYHVLRRYGVAVSDAEDLVQEVFLVMWRRWLQYDPKRPIRPWLAGIAFRVAYNHRQRAAREVPGGMLDLEDARPDPEQSVASDSARTLVWRVMESLPEKHRFLILTHEVDGVSVREIAETLGVPIPTAHTRLRAARKAFAKALKQLQTVSATRARLAPLLQAAPAADRPPVADAQSQVSTDRRRRGVARARRLALLPGFELLGSRSSTPLPGLAVATAGRAWWPVSGAAVLGAAGMLLVLIWGDSRTVTRWLRQTPTMSVASAQAAAAVIPPAPPAPLAVATPPTFVWPPRQASTIAVSGATTLARGLIGYWRFDEPPGSPSAHDLSGQGNDCLLRRLDPDVAWTEGRLGGAIQLNGLGWLECARVDALSRLGSDLTIGMWLRRQGPQQRVRGLVTRQYGSSKLDLFHLGFRDDELWMRTRFRGQVTRAAFPPQRDAWHHLTATLDASGRTRLYIDGEQVIQRQRDGQPPLGGGANPLIIGGGLNTADTGVANELFQGVIDELSIYNRRLDGAEIRALAAGAQPSLSP
jgi:RNA polymerase sigma factor (sigma-70 family)